MNSQPARAKVTILTEMVPHYRKPFFEQLRKRLADDGIELALVFGRDRGTQAAKQQGTALAWGLEIENRHFAVGSRELCWQPALPLLRDADLVIVEQASRMLTNYPLFGLQRLGRCKLAFWGHGRNFKASRSEVGEALKRAMSRRVHWWFSYTELSSDELERLGYPAQRITTVRNAIDTRALGERKASVGRDELLRLREALGLRSENVGIFVGGMYPLKRLPYLLTICELVRREIPDFEMLFVGGGSDANVVEQAAKRHPWVHYAGVQLGQEAVPYYMLSRLTLMPGLVGLAVLDAMALGVPLVTTNAPYHSPEIAYLRHGQNGWIVPSSHDPIAYAIAVSRLLKDEATRQKLVSHGLEDAQRYTLEAMVERFATGIGEALTAPRL